MSYYDYGTVRQWTNIQWEKEMSYQGTKSIKHVC
jgi:hypothetical protein